MKLEIVERAVLKNHTVYSVSDEMLIANLQNLLSEDSNVYVTYQWYKGTSDVLLLSSSMDNDNEWALTIPAVDNRNLERVQMLLLTEGLSVLTDWIKKVVELRNTEPDVWGSYGITLRYENNQLSYHETKSIRQGIRPRDWPPID